ncbi:MAG: efflux RND transporter permease subunit, partial [Candidatus Electryoneaceae bacterium]|nr:efflux RND transporter permease subunit [Candidatus Electryoneaceae bacterium]
MKTRISTVIAMRYTNFTIRHPFVLLVVAGIITILSLYSASHLEMRMNWTDMLVEEDPIVVAYEDIQDRFGNAASLVVVLEGDYDRIIEMARVVEPKLKTLGSLKNVQGELPLDFFREHGMVLLKPNDFERSMRIYTNSDMIGSLRGLNDDYDREYSDNESNLRRDEVNVARSILGIKKTLDVLYANILPVDDSGGSNNELDSDIPPIADAVDAMMLGERWMISLDRRMLMIMCEPYAGMTEIDAMMATVAEVERVMDEIRPQFPDVSADLTGMAKISQDEMNSIGVHTQILGLIALILIYLLLVWSFRSWLIPVITMIPLIVGIIWTMGLMYVLFGGLNLFTAMMMLVLLGLGIDFSIHLVSRFGEEIGRGMSLNDALVKMLGGTGVGVTTGAMTTAAAFLMLMIGDTSGVFEFGAASGLGVLLTLAAIFITMPSMLIIRQRRKGGKGFQSSLMVEGSPLIGRIARTGWNHPVYFITVAVLLAVGSYWAMKHIGYEYDFLELEPEGLKSVDLQREIPKRFGLSDHASWAIAGSI